MESEASSQQTLNTVGTASIPEQQSINTNFLELTKITPNDHMAAFSVKEIKIITYNCKNMETATALCALDALSKRAEIFLIQEHWYFDCQLHMLETVCESLNGCGKAVDTDNPILPIQMPRGYGGAAILWKKEIDHLVTKVPDGGNRIQCIEISTTHKPLLLVSVYMPCKGLKGNVEEFTDCLAQLTEIYEKYTHTHILVIGGDFNEELDSKKGSERKRSLEEFIRDCSLTRRKTGKTFVNPSGVEVSCIDFFLYSSCIDEKVVTPY